MIERMRRIDQARCDHTYDPDGGPVARCTEALNHDGIHRFECASTGAAGFRCAKLDNHEGVHVHGRHFWGGP